MAQAPQERYQDALRQVLRGDPISAAVVEAKVDARVDARIRSQEATTSHSTPRKTPSSTSPASTTLRNPANRLWTKSRQREAFIQHLENWAANHDSSTYFHGSISLHPQGTFPGEVLELGKSVNCLLFDSSTRDPPKKVVIRLFQQSRGFRGDAPQFRKKDPGVSFAAAKRESSSKTSKENYRVRLLAQHHQFVAPYQLVIRSGSGWLSARQYLDKHYFAHREKMAKEVASRSLASTSFTAHAQQPTAAFLSNFAAQPLAPVGQTALHQANAMFSLVTGFSINVNSSQVPGWVSSTNNHVAPGANAAGSITNSSSTRHVTVPTSTTLEQRDQSLSSSTRAENAEPSSFAKDTVKIRPLFRPFFRLPQELQDEILYHAVGYTRVVSVTRAINVKHASSLSTSPISISKLFRISKTINEHMVAHIFRTTNFHFGITGFTKFLWQIGPANRSNIQNLTFHFGKASLLHCVRWLAPDSIWELFEPPVATNPPTLTYFWRCQLQDLMKELKLSTLTVDIRGVSLTDVPMLLRVVKTAIGNIEHIRIIDNPGPVGTFDDTKERVQGLHRRFPDMQEPTWRELSLNYYDDYKHQRWHMRHTWAMHGVDLREPLNEWMDKDKAFFDA